MTDSRVQRQLGGNIVSVIEVEDLVVLKLLAFRDQDVADVLALVTSCPGLSGGSVLSRAREQDLGERIMDAASRLRFHVHTGSAVETAERLAGLRLAAEDSTRIAHFLETLMNLEEE